MAILFNYAAVLLCIGTLIGSESASNRIDHRGIRVSLATSCPVDEMHQRDNFVISFLRDGSIWFNSQQVDERALQNEVAFEIRHRQSKIVWIAADDGVSYGAIVQTISTIMKDTPDLRIVMTTKTQTGPVDPAGNYHAATGRPDTFFAGIDGLCIAP